MIALEGLYGKEIGENHPLYRDYRDAMRTRQEDRALTILRSIVRINPEDPNARSELNRLSTKFLREAVGKVAAFFAGGRQEEAVTLMKRMELFGASALTGNRNGTPRCAPGATGSGPRPTSRSSMRSRRRKPPGLATIGKAAPPPSGVPAHWNAITRSTWRTRWRNASRCSKDGPGSSPPPPKPKPPCGLRSRP